MLVKQCVKRVFGFMVTLAQSIQLKQQNKG